MIECESITVTDKRNDRPRFVRTYTAPLSAGRSVKIEFDSYLSRRATYGWLYQRNGNHLMFEIDKVAEQILDPVLVPEVQEAVIVIKAMDKVFINNRPSSYTDEDGVKWCRCG
jgi:hypothetical protein